MEFSTKNCVKIILNSPRTKQANKELVGPDMPIQIYLKTYQVVFNALLIIAPLSSCILKIKTASQKMANELDGVPTH